MTVYNKSDWTKTTTLLVMAGIPGYDYDAATVIVETYLAGDGGGWNPDDEEEPTGNGLPTNTQTPEQASVTIIDRAFGTTNSLKVTFNVNLTLEDVGSFPTGTSTADMFSAVQANLQARVTELFDKDIKLNNFDFATKVVTTRLGGYLTPTQRVAVNNEITGSVNLIDPAAIATAFARNIYQLNNTWMATKLYKRANYPIVVFVNKFTDTTYTTQDVSYVDGDDTITYQGYVIYIDPVTFAPQTCLISPLSTTSS